MTSAMPETSCTVFISYRRTVSWSTARLILKDLTNYGFHVFMDVENLGSGEFEREILTQISVCVDFIVILEPGSLDGIVDDSDWLRREIAQAIVSKRNIVPLTCNGFSLHDVTLPADIASLARFNEIPISHENFDAAMQRLRKRFLQSIPLGRDITDELKRKIIALRREGKTDDQIVEALRTFGISHRDLQLIESSISEQPWPLRQNRTESR